LESVYELDYPNYNVVLLDNNSTDNSLNRIRKYCSDYNIKISEFTEEVDNKLKKEIFNAENNSNNNLILIKNKKNYGYTKGNNIGIKFALNNLIPNYLLILNNDTKVDKNLLKNMVLTSQKDEKIAILQPKLLFYDDHKIINTTGNKMDIFGSTMARGFCEIDSGQFDNLRTTGFFYASGACFMIKKKFILEFNKDELFDSLLFAYHEDVDLNFTARILGFNIVYCPEAICYHKQGGSPKNYYIKLYWIQRNKFRIIIKNYSFQYLIFILPTSIFIDFLSALFSTLYRMKLEYIKIFLKSIIWNIKNISNTIEKRKIIQSKRKVSDKEIMQFMELKPLNFYIDIKYLLNKYI